MSEKPTEDRSLTLDVHVPSDYRHPAPIKRDHLGEVKGALARGRDHQVRRARKIVRQILRASEIGGADYDYSTKPKDWTDEEFRISMDARKPKREVPFYQEVAKSTVEVADKEPEKADQLNVGQVINFVQITYPTKKLEG